METADGGLGDLHGPTPVSGTYHYDIQLRESNYREFKSAYQGPPDARSKRDAKSVGKDIGEALVAFANADGGELLVGVEDEGTVTGHTYNEGTVAKLLEAHKSYVHPDTPLTDIVSRSLQLEGREVLFFATDKSTRFVHLTSDGRCLQRRDRETVPVPVEHLQFERQEQLSRSYDRAFVDGAHSGDLEIDLIERVSSEVAKGMSPEKCLQFLGLAEYGIGHFKIRRAALLLFARDISRWHPRCQVRILRVRGTDLKPGKDYNAVSDETVAGTLFRS